MAFRTGFGLRMCLPPYPAMSPRMWFLFVGAALCLRLPSDPASRRQPLPFGERFLPVRLAENFHLQVSAPCRAHKRKNPPCGGFLVARDDPAAAEACAVGVISPARAYIRGLHVTNEDGGQSTGNRAVLFELQKGQKSVESPFGEDPRGEVRWEIG